MRPVEVFRVPLKDKTLASLSPEEAFLLRRCPAKCALPTVFAGEGGHVSSEVLVRCHPHLTLTGFLWHFFGGNCGPQDQHFGNKRCDCLRLFGPGGEVAGPLVVKLAEVHCGAFLCESVGGEVC